MLWGRTRTCLVKVCHDSQCMAETLTYILKIVWEAKRYSLSAKQKRCWKVFLPSLPDETTELSWKIRINFAQGPHFPIHSSVDTHLSWFYKLAIGNKRAKWDCMQENGLKRNPSHSQNKTGSKRQISHVVFQMWILDFIYIRTYIWDNLHELAYITRKQMRYYLWKEDKEAEYG